MGLRRLMKLLNGFGFLCSLRRFEHHTCQLQQKKFEYLILLLLFNPFKVLLMILREKIQFEIKEKFPPTPVASLANRHV